MFHAIRNLRRRDEISSKVVDLVALIRQSAQIYLLIDCELKRPPELLQITKPTSRNRTI